MKRIEQKLDSISKDKVMQLYVQTVKTIKLSAIKSKRFVQ